MKIKTIITSVALLTFAVACDDLFEPGIENNHNLESVEKDPSYAQGLLGYGYSILPYDTKSTSDVATDDAVTNDQNSAYSRMALGAWAANNNPMQQWQSRKAAIQYLNTFFQVVEKTQWAKNERVQKMFCDRLTGECYALRALNMYYLLMAHGGKTADGELLGVPILSEPEAATSNFNLPRDKFSDCVKFIFDDLDKAMELLPLDYQNISTAEVPAKYKGIGVTNASEYNRVFGDIVKGRISGRIAEAFRAQVALMASSPAFVDASGVTSEQAANYAAAVLNRIGGVSGMDAAGYKWFMKTSEIESLGSGNVPKEIIWRSDISQGEEEWDIGLDQEAKNFPPSLYGSGRINPTQNLVDAFPMANGYPIADAASAYDNSKPYADRDPRLSEYIIYNGMKYKDQEVVTGTYNSGNSNGLNYQSTSTRTGYYMRKLLREDCNPNPSAKNAKKHYTARIRYTEIFLSYAEAANEAWGPTGKGAHTYSAYDVVKAIRARAGVGADNNDAYLESIKNDKDKMRQLIRNERRIELCFENKRFWDLRRWKAPLDETARGVEITKVGSDLNYKYIDVETRNYKEYMCYGPIPYTETLKWTNLKQNAGW